MIELREIMRQKDDHKIDLGQLHKLKMTSNTFSLHP